MKKLFHRKSKLEDISEKIQKYKKIQVSLLEKEAEDLYKKVNKKLLFEDLNPYTSNNETLDEHYWRLAEGVYALLGKIYSRYGNKELAERSFSISEMCKYFRKD